MKIDKQTVLVIDDSEVDRYLLTRQLSQTGLSLETLDMQDAEETLEYLKTCMIDTVDGFPDLIIFIDMRMPRMNGLEFIEEFVAMRENGLSLDVGIILMSSSENVQLRQKALSYDFVGGFLNKNEITSSQLKSKIEALQHQGFPFAKTG